MRYILLLTPLLLLQLVSTGQEFRSLWPPGKKPNWNGREVKDSIYNERVWQVGTPGIYAFPVAAAENKGSAVVICPGGGYERLSYLYNGFNFAHWFNAQGINAFVLLYRLPHQKDLVNRQLAPLQDAQRAIKLIRANASRWNLKPQQIGVMGISSGGHVASLLGTQEKDESRISDLLDTVSCRPSFLVLLSPVISMGPFAHAGSKKNFLGADTSLAMVRQYSTNELVTRSTPPCFLVHAANDKAVPVQNSTLFFSALLAHNVPVSFHVFPQGGHGIRLADNPGSTELWLPLLQLWLKETGFASPVKTN